ncbi:GT4 family glycosyltransferase PelF [Flavobacterium sp.]|jgi:glycosyltransferase involved in cell wall biosynthesis|uniref:GT4 family glycosyltransferase PelF n=1 Tax=Flavobacterium sp. TaxID=239 RepID=UPI002C42787B|nr:GT4 family glycosyltransferase PelF [Flavobacterium sp.]MCA0347633.1 GT4 family glycosyltransferase PelF [Bacteroidota bacterium]HQA74123.1 GT4 family glycosyltransferase PelF [Flavobacterium sp.]
MAKKHDVLLILEGTYPYNGGGVSTWSHMLCNEVKNANFNLYSINANFEIKPKYTLGENVKNVIQVPLWSPLEPQEMIDYGKKYHKIVKDKERSDEKDIQAIFLPIFVKLIKSIYSDTRSVEDFDSIIYAMWKYFQTHDYKKTMLHDCVWKSFCNLVNEIISNDKENATLFDLTLGMRWIYRFLIPLSIDVPKADISHLTISGFPVIPALVLKYKYDTPIIATEHGVFIRERLIAINTSEYSFFLKKLLIRFSESITELVYYKADAIISVNKFNMTWERMYGANPDKLEVIYNGVDHKLFVPKPKPEVTKNIPTVVAAARIFELKDILTMIRSCAVVKKTIPNVQYLVYGDNDAVPEYTKECNRLIEELGITANFKLAGYHSKPHELFCEGDISILTSISEGFPYTVIESMSCGIPVVATDVGGVSEALDSSTGFICKPKDFEEIASRVVELLQNDELRMKMGRNAREKVINNFTIDKFIKGYEYAYDRIIAEKEQLSAHPIFIQMDAQEAQEAS